MTTFFPRTLYACPCSDLSSAPKPLSSKRASIQPSTHQLNEEQALNPHSPRGQYALYPLDLLLFCDECDEIRCPRCWTEEVLYWYCPMCLFEVPSSQVQGDGNRCSRSCYDCPSCTSPLQVTQISNKDEGLLKPSDAPSSDETYVLQCHYCEWSSLEIDVRFSKPTKITEQLARQRKLRPGGKDQLSPSGNGSMDHDDAFVNLATFYKDQLNESIDPQNPYSSSPYGSPANLARIMNLYGGLSYNALKKTREKPRPMREALTRSEGLKSFSKDSAGFDILQAMQSLGWDSMATAEQQSSAPVNYDANFSKDLWPCATWLRTRRAKRCKSCRHIIARPDPKVGSMRYKIRLLAMSYVSRLSIRPLHSPLPLTNPAFHVKPDPPLEDKLQPHKAQQYVLTVRNPIFETVKISLATPATTPGRVQSRVTILCPSFTVGPAGDVWDEALSASTQSTSDGGRQAAMASLVGSSEGSDRQPEAGKVWEKTRNSTSVIMEIVPGSLRPPPSIVPKSEDELAAEELEEDDDVLEVSVYVRAEWQSEVKPGESVQAKKDATATPGERVSKEIGYWVVLAVGRIAI